MKRYSFLKENGEVLRLIVDEKDEEKEEIKKALESWKSRWGIISVGESTGLFQGEKLVFSDDMFLFSGNRFSLEKRNGTWFLNSPGLSYLADEKISLSYLIEP